MDFSLELMEIVRCSVLDLTRKLGGVVLWRCSAPPVAYHTFAVHTTGPFCLRLIFHVEPTLMRRAAEHMAHGAVEDMDDIIMYNREFFNILCGKIVVKINQRYGVNARFIIPVWEETPCLAGGGGEVPAFQASWQSAVGRVCARGFFCKEDPFFQQLRNESERGTL